MVNYPKSKEGIDEYKKIDRPYPDSHMDIDYEAFLAQIAEDNSKKTKIVKLSRIKTGEDIEYLVYDMILEGKNGIGSYDMRSRTNVGMYPIPRPKYERVVTTDNRIETKVAAISQIDTGYSIAFNKQNLEQLHTMCNDKAADGRVKTKYYAVMENGSTITIPKYEDFANGSFDDLFEHGRITSKK